MLSENLKYVYDGKDYVILKHSTEFIEDLINIEDNRFFCFSSVSLTYLNGRTQFPSYLDKVIYEYFVKGLDYKYYHMIDGIYCLIDTDDYSMRAFNDADFMFNYIQRQMLYYPEFVWTNRETIIRYLEHLERIDLYGMPIRNK